MISASDVLQRLDTFGVTVFVDGSDLVLRPGDQVPVDLIPEIRASKPDLIRFLSPDPRFGAQAVSDARILADLIDAAPDTELSVIRARAADSGIAGLRWPFALCALPNRLNRNGWTQ